jgi:membrane protein
MAVTRVREDPAVTPQPERSEPAHLSLRDWPAIFVHAFKRFLANNGTMLASAVAYSTFFAIPSVLLVVVGAFTLVVGPDTITTVMRHFSRVIPGEATSLLGGSLHRLDSQPSTSLALTIVGFVLALWSTTSAMTTYMTAVDVAYGRKDKRSFIRKRLRALELVAVIGLAFLLVAVLLIFGPSLEHLVESHAGAASGAVAWIWWIAEWPILIGGLLVSFSILLDFGPDVPRKWRRRFVTPGSFFATAVWLAASGAFAFYTSKFGSYNKTWGSLAAVIVLLTWLWLAAVALLLGAELNAEAERARKLRAEEISPVLAPARRRGSEADRR